MLPEDNIEESTLTHTHPEHPYEISKEQQEIGRPNLSCNIHEVDGRM